MSESRLITVAIHTYRHAVDLKQLLESQGLEVTLQNVNLSSPVVSSGVRVRIHENDLPMALRVIENHELFNQKEDSVSTHEILVPIDFSDHSMRAAMLAFTLAYVHGATVTLLHTYGDPGFASRIQLADVLNFDLQTDDGDRRKALEQEATRQMDLFTNTLLGKIKSGEIPGVKYYTYFSEGLPEEVINQYSKSHSPLLIVMGTRGADKKERESVGSVTAEVLDTCRYPVFTVPETSEHNPIDALNNILFLGNLDQEDILALDALFRLIPDKAKNVKLVKIPNHKSSNYDKDSLRSLGEYCSKYYPDHHFSIDMISIENVEADFSQILSANEPCLITVPNKKRNILARLFNPGIAHKLLFHSDTPMMVIPV